MLTPPTTNPLVQRSPAASRPPPMELYQVIIHCRNEAQQRELYERLHREGFKCRVIVL